jgi:hypothetical protein
LLVPQADGLVATGDRWEPYRLTDAVGGTVGPVSVFFAELQAAGRAESTLRSYGLDLLRWWFRFLWAIRVEWNRATQQDACEFSRWIRLVDKPRRGRRGQGAAPPGSPNPVTGKPTPGTRYAAATAAHSETVLRSFYELHRTAGTGPILNPFPLVAGRGEDRPNAHHNPMEP